jgi:hypothetical protein
VNLSDPAAPQRIARFEDPNTGTMIKVGNYIYTAAGTVVDVSDPLHPRSTGNLGLGSWVTRFAVAGNTLVASEGYYAGRFNTFDVSDPSSPVLKATKDNVGSFTDMAATGNALFLLTGQTEFPGQATQVYDLSNASTPTLIATYNYDTKGYDVAAANNRLYQVRGGTGTPLLLAENITDPTSRSPIGTVNGVPFWSIGAAGDSVYATGKQSATSPLTLTVFQADLGGQVARPTLAARADGGKVVFSWSTDFPGMKLYSTTGLGDAWSLVTSTPYQVGSSFVFTNTRPVAPMQFFKLSSN